ncbi:hypothetical protein Bca52824_005412 [Brassica carinata]|uniref:Protein DGS1, mitochondrial n=1 Tax=Brassica carinata TaxID=52824 RepID=A0A8X7WRI1_BRACI|nr:hypothetical protein Bca52824_005412 [Brassica carinata]
MDSQPPANGSSPSTIGELVPLYSSYLWNRVASLIPTSNSIFLGKFSNLYRQTFTKKRHISLPLPLPSDFPCSSTNITVDTSRIYLVLEEIMSDVLSNLHDIQKSLEFWQSRAEGSNARKAYFMVFERGPVAFVDESVKLVRKSLGEDSAMQHLCQSSSSHMFDRMRVLMELRSSLASFLAQLYVELDKRGEDLLKNPEKSLPSLLAVVDRLFSNLEGSFSHLHAARESDSSIDGSYSMPLVFDRLPEINEEGSQWTDCELTDAINLVHKNLEKLNSYLSVMVSKHRKPRRMTLYWVRYTCGAVGLSVLSIWLLRHSSLMGSSDIENWIHDAKQATVSFFSDHVEQPLLAIRDELLILSEKDTRVSWRLKKMLRNFCDQATAEKVSDNATDQEMLEVVMHRYEKNLCTLFTTSLVESLSGVQKLKLDIETAMLELEQILRANEINFAILAALPAFFLSLGMLALLRTWLKQDSKAQGRGRIARIHRRLLVVEIEKRIMHYQSYIEQGRDKDAETVFGLLIYSLERLYRVVETPAKQAASGILKQDLIELGRPQQQTSYKLTVTQRLVTVYDCLLPSLTRQ